jgi:hypothetical protein
VGYVPAFASLLQVEEKASTHQPVDMLTHGASDTHGILIVREVNDAKLSFYALALSHPCLPLMHVSCSRKVLLRASRFLTIKVTACVKLLTQYSSFVSLKFDLL